MAAILQVPAGVVHNTLIIHLLSISLERYDLQSMIPTREHTTQIDGLSYIHMYTTVDTWVFMSKDRQF